MAPEVGEASWTVALHEAVGKFPEESPQLQALARMAAEVGTLDVLGIGDQLPLGPS